MGWILDTTQKFYSINYKIIFPKLILPTYPIIMVKTFAPKYIPTTFNKKQTETTKKKSVWAKMVFTF